RLHATDAENYVRLSSNARLQPGIAWTQDNTAKPSWLINLFGETATDRLEIDHFAPGGAMTTLFTLDNAGTITTPSYCRPRAAGCQINLNGIAIPVNTETAITFAGTQNDTAGIANYTYNQFILPWNNVLVLMWTTCRATQGNGELKIYQWNG